MPSVPQNEQLPKATAEGVLHIGDARIPCAVLDDGRRVLTTTGVLKALGRAKMGGVGKLPVFMAAANLKPLISQEFLGVTKPVAFRPMQGGRPAYGFTADILPGLCRLYGQARRAGVLRKNQEHVAAALERLSDGLMGVAMVALVDEATGYQRLRANDALQVKLRAYIADEMRGWEKLFPDELWRQFARLTRWHGEIHQRPKYWGKLVRELVYDALDPEISAHLQTSVPPSRAGARWHQWLTEDFGARVLTRHIGEVVGIAKSCHSLRELRERVREVYAHGPAQVLMYLPRGGAA